MTNGRERMEMAKNQLNMSRKEKRAAIIARLIAAPTLSDRVIADGLNVSHVTVRTIRMELQAAGRLQNERVAIPAADWQNHSYIRDNPDIVADLNERGLRAMKSPGVVQLMAERGLTSPIYAQRVLNREAKAARKNAAITMAAEDILIKQDDLMTGLPWIIDASVDLIITDLPYSRDYIHLYSALSKLAGRVLRDGGSILCMTGQSALPAVLQALCEDERLRYHWTLTAVMPRSACNLNWLKVSSHTKPIIHLTKGGNYTGDWYSDYITANPADKTRDIAWEQPQDVFDELTRRFIQRSETVLLDPCCGSGTSLISGIKTGLCSRVIGVDIDSVAIKTARKRVDELLYGGNADE